LAAAAQIDQLVTRLLRGSQKHATDFSRRKTMSTAFNQAISSGYSMQRTGLARIGGELAVILLMSTGVLAPGITLSADFPKMRSELFVGVAIVVVYAWMFLAGFAKLVRFHAFYLIAFVFSICVSLSIIYGAVALQHEIQLRDLYELPKAWMPVLFFSIAYEAELSEQGLKQFMNYFAIAIIFVCLFGWAQYWGLGIARALQPYYGDGDHNDIALLLYRRIYATLTNPNYLGQLLSWTTVAYTLGLVFDREHRLRNSFIPLICVATIALTGSRYGILATMFGLSIVVFMAVRSKRHIGRVAGLLILIGAIGVIFSATAKNSYFATKRYSELQRPMEVGSLRGRLDVLWLDAANEFVSSPWVGHGPSKKFFEDVYTDSEYLDILKWFGAFGFLAYSAYYIWPFTQLVQAMKQSRFLAFDLQERLSANLVNVRIGIALLMMALFMNIGEFTCFHLYLMCFLWGWVGLSVRSAHFLCVLREKSTAGSLYQNSGFLFQQPVPGTFAPQKT
jgi:hypothetical protein